MSVDKLRGLNIVVVDSEIKNEIKDGITWNDHHLMGHAVSALYDYRTDDFSIYFDDNVDHMIERINEADLVVHFNGKSFDQKLWLACPSIKTRLRPDIDLNVYDMLEESRRACGWVPGTRFPTGLRLDDHLEAMFGKEGMKSGDGANAPILFQKKKLGELCTYVLRDLKVERKLFEFVWTHGYFETAAHGKRIVKELPQDRLAKILADRAKYFPPLPPQQSGAV